MKAEDVDKAWHKLAERKGWIDKLKRIGESKTLKMSTNYYIEADIPVDVVTDIFMQKLLETEKALDALGVTNYMERRQ